MELLVTVSLSDRLFSLLEDKLPNLGRRIEKAITKEIGAQTRKESAIKVAVDSDTTVSETPAVDTQQKVETTRSEKTRGEMIREIMHRTRQRFEGEDYKDNTDSEAYKKYHRALTSQFKQIAMQLGHEKPSYLDTAEKVDSFAEMCDALIIDEKGFIAPPQHRTK